jgi:hypothetical protein
MIAAVSLYWEFGTSSWQLEEQDISAKGSDRGDKVSKCKGSARMSANAERRRKSSQPKRPPKELLH